MLKKHRVTRCLAKMAQLVCSLNNSKNTRLCFGSTYREVKIILGNKPHINHFFHVSNFWFLQAKGRELQQNIFYKKLRKSPQNRFLQQKQEQYQISSHLSCGDICCVEKFKNPLNVDKFQISPH